jgi:hypothetical protein
MQVPVVSMPSRRQLNFWLSGYCASFGLASAQVRHALQTRVLAAHLLLGLEAIVDRVEDELRLDLDEHKQRPLHRPPPTIPKAS